MKQILSSELSQIISNLLPFLLVAGFVLLLLVAANWFFLHRKTGMGEEGRFTKRILMVLLTCAGGVAVILSFPIDSVTKGHLLSLLGILLSAVIALSSTTFVANAMAGLMVRSVCSFGLGDFIKVDNQYGRVTERGLIHTEIQTEDRDLVTIPNLYLITNPVKVTRESGTIVSANVSLGYDVPNELIEKILIKAALAAKLHDPFVQILELGDFSVSYRVAGFLNEVKQILSVRSTLRKMILNTLHNANVEIVSPTFMNQRVLKHGEHAIPSKKQSVKKAAAVDHVQEELIFDKAEEVKQADDLRHSFADLEKGIDILESKLKKADVDTKSLIEDLLQLKKTRLKNIKQRIREGKAGTKDMS